MSTFDRARRYVRRARIAAAAGALLGALVAYIGGASIFDAAAAFVGVVGMATFIVVILGVAHRE